MKWLLVIIGILASVLGVVFLVGFFLPKEHKAVGSNDFPTPPEQVWSVVTDFSQYASWRSGVIAVETLPEKNGHRIWKEVDAHGEAIPYEMIELVPNKRLVNRIADPNLPFGGTWTFELGAISTGTKLTITEDGEVYNPFFRFVSRFIIGHTTNIEKYFSDLQRKFGENKNA